MNEMLEAFSVENMEHTSLLTQTFLWNVSVQYIFNPITELNANVLHSSSCGAGSHSTAKFYRA